VSRSNPNPRAEELQLDGFEPDLERLMERTAPERAAIYELAGLGLAERERIEVEVRTRIRAEARCRYRRRAA
jgi:hypothetical protein